MTALTWAELGAHALARQFPALAPAGPDDSGWPADLDDPGRVAEAVRRIGPIQSQTARSPFLGLAARFPGLAHVALTEAYESFAVVRGSTIRGTVHATVPEHHALLEVATRTGQRGLYARQLRLRPGEPEALWAATETFAHDTWRTPEELLEHLRAWMGDRTAPDRSETVAESLDRGVGRYLGFGHGGLLRRPLRGGWEGQGAAGYRTAAAVLPGDRAAVLSDPQALDRLFRVHLAAHGPASRHDLAWWSGLRVTLVDEVLARLDLEAVTGPDGRDYVDLPDGPSPRDLPGVRLLPEFDALMCAYHPTGRQRFITPEHHDLLWTGRNGLMLPALLVDGRITGYWRTPGSGRRRPLEVRWFAGTRRPHRADLEAPVAALEAALAITVTSVSVGRA